MTEHKEFDVEVGDKILIKKTQEDTTWVVLVVDMVSSYGTWVGSKDESYFAYDGWHLVKREASTMKYALPLYKLESEVGKNAHQ